MKKCYRNKQMIATKKNETEKDSIRLMNWLSKTHATFQGYRSKTKTKKLSQKSLHCIYVCRPLKSEPFHELFMKNHRSFVIYVMQYKQRMVPNIWIRVVSNFFFSYWISFHLLFVCEYTCKVFFISF